LPRQLDASIAAQSPPPSRPEAIRHLLKERLSGGLAVVAPPDDITELRRKFLMLARRVEEMAARRG